MALQPGANRLTFRVTVLKQGLYVLKHVLARIGRLTLRLRSALAGTQHPCTARPHAVSLTKEGVLIAGTGLWRAQEDGIVPAAEHVQATS